MTRSAVASRYANALADVVTAATSPVKPADAALQLRAFAAIMAGSPALRQALETPVVPVARKRAVVDRVADLLSLPRLTRNFLAVLVDHRRIAALAQIAGDFEAILDERLGIARAEVTSAAELIESQRAALNPQLERLSGKRIRAVFRVDPALIGGVVARIGSTVYDGSVRGQLEDFGRRLNAEA